MASPAIFELSQYSPLDGSKYVQELRTFDEIVDWSDRERKFWLAMFAQQPNVHIKPYQTVRDTLFGRLDKVHHLAVRGTLYEKRAEEEDFDLARIQAVRAQLAQAMPNYASGEALLSSSDQARYISQFEDKQLRVHIYAVFTGIESVDSELETQAFLEVYRFHSGPGSDGSEMRLAIRNIQRQGASSGANRTNSTLFGPSKWHWDSLRALGQSRPVQLTALIPILGYFILFGEQYAEYFRLSLPRINDDQSFGGYWRVYFLYFGFSALAVGSFLFSMFCPSVVKEHSSGARYAAVEESTLLRSEEEDIIRYNSRVEFLRETQGSIADYTLASKHAQVINSGLTSLNIRQIPSEKLREHTSKLNEIAIRNAETPLPALMKSYYNYESCSAPGRRTLVTWSYSIGFALILAPTIFTFLQISFSALVSLITTIAELAA